MAKWNNNGIGEGGTTRTCSQCNITQTVTIYDGKVTFKYCPYCGARMVDAAIDDDMTSKELHVKRIVPARQEVNLLEEKYRKLYRKECAEENGLKIANCSNCAYSCVLMIDDHNGCLGGKCTCCNDFCYKWMPETKVSAWIREHHEYDDGLVYRLEDMFGDDFLKCDDVDMIMRALQLMDEVQAKAKEKRS